VSEKGRDEAYEILLAKEMKFCVSEWEIERWSWRERWSSRERERWSRRG